uniref:Ssu-2 homolog n=1 Tax=Chrysemys picta bellii TaxID=8478 RepID=A0A8C3P736_CHRPI
HSVFLISTLAILDLESEPESPLAPPADLLEQLDGYEWTLRDGEFIILMLILRIPTMTEDMARIAFLSFVNSKCCYGNKAAGELVIQNLRQMTVYRYRLETYHESRLSEWTFQPFTNNLVDGPQNGASPRPWDIKVQAPPMFQDDTKKFRVPHSSLVKVIQSMDRLKSRAKCMRCVTCSGARHRKKQQKRCKMRSGTGRKRCSTCSGRGNKTCMTCQGEKKLLHFIQLIITCSIFSSLNPQHISCHAGWVCIPFLFKFQVYPIVDFPKPEISLASQRAITEHNAAFATSSRILQQVSQIVRPRVKGVGI